LQFALGGGAGQHGGDFDLIAFEPAGHVPDDARRAEVPTVLINAGSDGVAPGQIGQLRRSRGGGVFFLIAVRNQDLAFFVRHSRVLGEGRGGEHGKQAEGPQHRSETES